MSERLTEQQLDGMSRWMEESNLPAFAMHCGPLAAKELRDRRAADLTAFDRMVVEVWRDRLETDTTVDRHFIAVLDKLLAGGGAR